MKLSSFPFNLTMIKMSLVVIVPNVVVQLCFYKNEYFNMIKEAGKTFGIIFDGTFKNPAVKP